MAEAAAELPQGSSRAEQPGAEQMDELTTFSKALQQLCVEHDRLLAAFGVRCERQRLLEEEVARLRLHTQTVSTDIPTGAGDHVGECSRGNDDKQGCEPVTGGGVAMPQFRTGATADSSQLAVEETNTIENQFTMMMGNPSTKSPHSVFGSIGGISTRSQDLSMVSFVQSQHFNLFCAAAIVLNALLLGLGVEYAAQGLPRDPLDLPFWYKSLDMAFTIWFVLELSMRIVCSGRNFLIGEGWSWNWLDLIVVTLDVLEKAVLASLADSGSSLRNITSVRILRTLRITRAIRVIKVVHRFRELRIMVYSILRSASSFCWSMLIIIIIIYIFSIFMVQSVSEYLFREGPDVHNYDKLRDHWGSLTEGHYTLFQVMTGGISWGEVSNPVITIHWSNGLVIAFFVFFTVLVVSNIITGIFVDVAIQGALNDREEAISEELHSKKNTCWRLKAIFEEADTDGSGAITFDEFERHLSDRRVRAHLASLGIEVDKAEGLFRLLDMDDSNSIGLQEFVIGCLRLKGGAKAIDLVTLMYENKRLLGQFRALFDTLKRQLSIGVAHHEAIPPPCDHWIFRSKETTAAMRPAARDEDETATI